MVFRIAVREAESWLLADPTRLSAFLGIRVASIPANPDTLTDPKATMVALARRSRKKAIREGMVPAAGTSAHVGPEYVSLVSEFAMNHWSPEDASRSSDSLARCIAKLRTVTGYGRIHSGT
jgi:hypothetical protein